MSDQIFQMAVPSSVSAEFNAVTLPNAGILMPDGTQPRCQAEAIMAYIIQNLVTPTVKLEAAGHTGVAATQQIALEGAQTSLNIAAAPMSPVNEFFYQLSMSIPDVSITHGNSGTANLQATAFQAGVLGSRTLSVFSGLVPALGTTNIAFGTNPISVPFGTPTSILTITVDAAAVPGVYPIIIQESLGGTPRNLVQFNLTVL